MKPEYFFQVLKKLSFHCCEQNRVYFTVKKPSDFPPKVTQNAKYSHLQKSRLFFHWPFSLDFPPPKKLADDRRVNANVTFSNCARQSRDVIEQTKKIYTKNPCKKFLDIESNHHDHDIKNLEKKNTKKFYPPSPKIPSSLVL